jgi:hypothetical protein
MRSAALLVLCASVVASAGRAAADTDGVAPPPDGTGVRRSQAADTRRIVAILDVRVDGVPDDVKKSFQTSLEQQLDTKHYWLATYTRVHQALANSTKWTEGCVVGPCLAEVKTQTGADLVLLAALTGSGTSFGFVVTLVRTDTGRVLAQESDRCDVCTVSEAMTKATLATIGILNAVPDVLPDEAAASAAAMDSAVARARLDAASAARHHSHVGVAITIVGLAAAAAGVGIYIAKDHPDYALATAVGGGGLALGGICILAF